MKIPSSPAKDEIIIDNAVKCAFSKVDEINLIDRDDDVTNAEQRTDERVTPGLNQHAFSRVNENHGEFSIRGARSPYFG